MAQAPEYKNTAFKHMGTLSFEQWQVLTTYLRNGAEEFKQQNEKAEEVVLQKQSEIIYLHNKVERLEAEMEEAQHTIKGYVSKEGGREHGTEYIYEEITGSIEYLTK